MRSSQVVDTDLPLGSLYRSHRDELAQWGPSMPEVRRVKQVERTVDGPHHTLRNTWWGADTALPWMVRRFVPEDAMSWEDEQVWDDDALTCDWVIRIPALGDSAVLRGCHRYIEADGATRIQLDGEFRFIPGEGPLHVPAFVAPTIERAVGALVGALLSRSVRVLAQHVRAA